MSEATVDTNVLVRYLTNDPPDMAQRAAEVLQEAQTRRIDLVVAPIVIAEVVFVLESVYGWTRDAIAGGLLALLDAAVFQVLDPTVVRQTLHWYRDHPRVHFVDAYVAALAVERGHSTVISFDRDLRRVPGLHVVGAAEHLPQ